MWSQFEASANEDETLGNSFCTVGLFKISNEEKVKKNSENRMRILLFTPFVRPISERQKSECGRCDAK